MANPCVLYNGKKYTREEFAALLHDGELSTLLKNNKVKKDVLVGEIPSVFDVQQKEMSVISPERSSNYANLTENKDGDFVFFHVGDEGYETIKPASGVGTKTSTGEAAAIGKVGGVAMYYTRPDDQESMVKGPAKYAVTVPKEKVYDFNADENNYAEEAKAMHEAENPGKAFDANTELAYVTKIAGENGYDMVVAEWDGKTRAQTTKELKPSDYLSMKGDVVTKPFNEQYQSNTDKGMVSVVPESKQAKLEQIYKDINNERNTQNKYDDLYRLAENFSKMEQADITKLINESDISQEIKDRYNKELNRREGKRRTYLKTKSVNIEGAPEGVFLNIGMEAGVKGDMLTIEEIKESLPDDVEVVQESVRSVKSEVNGEMNEEPTLIVKLSRPLTDAEMQKLLVDTQQMGIAQMIDGEGTVHGTEAWGGFNADYFYMPNKRSLSDVISKPNEKTVEQEVDELSDMFSTNVEKAVENAKKALSKLLPNVKFVIHDNYDSYVKAVGEEDVVSSGTYIDNTIHINKSAATKTTVAHEAFHAVLLNMVKTDAKAAALTKKMIDALSSQLEGNQELKEYLENFASNYNENLKNEEKLAELIGYLSANYESLPKSSKSLVKRWLDALAKVFGLKSFTDNEVVDFMNTFSQKIATGQEITESEVNILGINGSVELKNTSPRSSIVGEIDLKRFPINKNASVKEGVPLTDFEGKKSNIMESDRLTGAYIADESGNPLFKFFGGIYYPAITGKWWASSNKATANKISKNQNKNRDKDGYVYSTPIIMGPESHMSNVDMFNAVWEFMKHDLRSKSNNVTKDLFHKYLDKAFSTKNLSKKYDTLSIKKNDNINDMILKLDDAVFGDNSSFTFEERKSLIKSLLGNPNVGTKRNFPSAGSISELAIKFEEPNTKKAKKQWDIVMIMRTKGDLSWKETSKDDEFYHKSYPFEIYSSDKVEVFFLDGAYNITDVYPELTKSTGDVFSWNEYLYKHSKISEKFAVSQYGRTGKLSMASGNITSNLNRKQSVALNNMIKTAKDSGFSDAAVSQYLQRMGYSATSVSEAIIDYNTKAIQQKQKSEGLLVKDLDNKVKLFAGGLRRRLASAKGFLPTSVFEAIENKDAKIQAQIKMMSINNKRFDSLLSKFKGDKDQLIKDFDAYLRGDKTIDMPLEFKAIADSMRSQISGLAYQMIDSGIVQGEVVDTIIKNMDSYLTRSYEIFDNKDWAKKLKEAELNKAKDYFRQTLMPIAIANSENTGLDVASQLEREVNNAIDSILSKADENGFVNSGKEGSKDLSILKKKEEIPMEIRALMGEYTDPIQNYAKTISKMAALVEDAKFLNKIKEAGMGKFFFEEKDPYKPKDYNVKIAGDTSKTYDPLNGIYTSKEIKEALSSGEDKVSVLSKAANLFPQYKIYMKALGLAKRMKTIESVATHMKNVIGNLEFMASGGYWKGYQEAFDVIKNDISGMKKDELNKKMIEYITVGVAGQDITINEIKSLFSGDTFDMEFERRMVSDNGTPIVNTSKKAYKKTKKYLWDLPAAMYQAEDDFFKIVAYENEKLKYAKAIFKKDYKELTENEKEIVKKEASDIIKDTMPNYSRIPKAAKILKVLPYSGTFISFPLEALRTSYNVVFNVAAKEIKSSNKDVRMIGYQRLFSLIATQGLKYLSMYLLAGAGSDDEDEKVKNAKRYVAFYSKNSDIVVVESGKGKASYIDFSASDPRGQISKTLNAFFSGENLMDSFAKAAGELISPFVSEDILFSTITSINRNEDPTGREIYNPEDTDAVKMEKSLDYIYTKAFEPGTITSIKKISKAENKFIESVGEGTGYKVRTVDIPKGLFFKSKEGNERLLDAKRIYNSAFYKYNDKKITKKELDDAYNRANEKVKEILEDVKKDYDASMFFGSDPVKIEQSMDDAGFSRKVINQIITGDFQDIESKIPLTPEEVKQKIEEAKENVREMKKKSYDLSEIKSKLRKERGQ
jgi:uncharacterized protein Yka (UPF0111/DUF47 family)/vacuolar-type H+-ATPase subunit H